MADKFNADEIFEIAEQIERNGSAFYRKSAQMMADQKAHDLLIMLADMEVRHEQLFKQMREELHSEDPAWLESFDDFEAAEESVKYLQAVANGKVFDLDQNSPDRLGDDATLADILRLAIQFEKDTVIFYLGIKGAVPAKLGQEKIDGLIEQELSHVTLLSDELASVAG
jgi:rubrerythrin